MPDSDHHYYKVPTQDEFWMRIHALHRRGIILADRACRGDKEAVVRLEEIAWARSILTGETDYRTSHGPTTKLIIPGVTDTV